MKIEVLSCLFHCTITVRVFLYLSSTFLDTVFENIKQNIGLNNIHIVIILYYHYCINRPHKVLS